MGIAPTIKKTLPFAVFLVLLASLLNVSICGHYQGVYLLRQGPYRFVLSDDVLLGQEDQVLFGWSWSSVQRHLQVPTAFAHGEPYLDYEWFTSDGSGFVRNIQPDGKVLLTCFSRFVDSDGAVPKGLFVGGGLPYHKRGDDIVKQNDTGMAFYNGKRWFHIWCNVNESIFVMPAAREIAPSSWEFLGGKIVESSPQKLVLKSSHRITTDGVNLRIDRFAFFKAGEPYFVLVNVVKNEGNSPATYYYVYGDEPWLGNFGSSAGNVGWAKDRLFPYEAGVDPKRYSYFGMYDCGNEAAGEVSGHTGIANFLESIAVRPDLMYFSNKIGSYAPESDKVPLSSPDNRVLFMQWGPKLSPPGDTQIYSLAVGMAGNDRATGLPVKPAIAWGAGELARVVVREEEGR